jgi:hypothetical protein
MLQLQMLLKFFSFVQKTWRGCLFIGTGGHPGSSPTVSEENTRLRVVWLTAVIFVKSQLSNKGWFVHECSDQFVVYL